MFEREPARVECNVSFASMLEHWAERCLTAVHGVAQDGVTVGTALQPNLMHASGLEADRNSRSTWLLIFDLIMQDGGLGFRVVRRYKLCPRLIGDLVHRVAPSAFNGWQFARHDRDIRLLHFASFELLRQSLSRFFSLRKYYDARDASIDAVGDSQVRLVFSIPSSQQVLTNACFQAIELPWRLGTDAGRLVHDQYVVVFENHVDLIHEPRTELLSCWGVAAVAHALDEDYTSRANAEQ